MAKLKLTKNELRGQEHRLKQLERYLPTLQLKKAMLQAEVQLAKQLIGSIQKKVGEQHQIVDRFASLLTETLSIDPVSFATAKRVEKSFENIAGLEVPSLKQVEFSSSDYPLFDTPPWVDGAIGHLKILTKLQIEVEVAKEKKQLLEEEHRQVSIRVNLFEKVLIPTAKQNMKKIRVFLSDQEISGVGRMKVTKDKKEKKKREKALCG